MPDRFSRLLIGTAAVLLAVATPVSAQQAKWTEVRARRQADGVTSLTIDVEYFAGELRVAAAAAGLLYDTHLKYDAARMQPERKWSVDGDAAKLVIGFEGIGDDGEIDLDLDMDDEDHGFLNLGLSPDVPTDLRMKVAAALSVVGLGGVPLTGLVYETGASDTEITFGSVNPASMETLKLTVGAAKFTAIGLGNARFRELEFKGGVGDVRLDFTGEWSADASATIEMGLGSLKLVVPEDLGVRITKSGFFTSLNAPGFQNVDSAWQSADWESARHHLDIRLRAALGSIEVRQVR